VRDAFSRYVLDVRLVDDMTTTTIRREFDRIFDRYGIPKAIQSDNGQPFASAMGLCGLTKLSAWWISLGIELIRSRPGCPQDNGGHERMHADIRREIQTTIAANVQEQQRLCDTWRTEFNHVRPHEALEMKTPSDLFRPSSRRAVVRAGGLPPDCQRRVVDDRGWVRYEMVHVYVATALAGYTIGLRREGRTVTVWFYELPIGDFVYGEDSSVQPILVAGEPDVPRRHQCAKCKRPRGRPRGSRTATSRREHAANPAADASECTARDDGQPRT
jgi:putative transposase